MSGHTAERQGDGWTPRVIHRALHAGDAVRVRGDFDVPELAGALGRVRVIEASATRGVWVVVDVEGYGPIHFRASELEHADDDRTPVPPDHEPVDALLAAHAEENSLAALASSTAAALRNGTRPAVAPWQEVPAR